MTPLLRFKSLSLLHCLSSVELVLVMNAQARAEVCEAQVVLDHLGGHEIVYVILIWSCL